MQRTINRQITCIDIGIHSGCAVQLTLDPLPVNSGIIFQRTDVSAVDSFIPVRPGNVGETLLSTSIINSAKTSVSTIEHLMAALCAERISNLLVKVSAKEVPIMDGSSLPFLNMISLAGIKTQNAPTKKIIITKEIKVEAGDSYIIATPCAAGSQGEISLSIDFAKSQIIGKQSYTMKSDEGFNAEVAAARTFGFLDELDYLKSKGLAKGASLNNAIGIDRQDGQEKIMNHEGLRCSDEFVKHKILDLYGDLYCGGSIIYGNIRGHKTSHALNNEFLNKLFASPSSYKVLEN